MPNYHNRPDIARIQECSNDVCCMHNKIFVEYKDEPVWSYLVCSFCGNVTICNLIVPDAVRAAFCRQRDFESGKEEKEMFDKNLQSSIGWLNWCRLSKEQ